MQFQFAEAQALSPQNTAMMSPTHCVGGGDQQLVYVVACPVQGMQGVPEIAQVQDLQQFVQVAPALESSPQRTQQQDQMQMFIPPSPVGDRCEPNGQLQQLQIHNVDAFSSQLRHLQQEQPGQIHYAERQPLRDQVQLEAFSSQLQHHQQEQPGQIPYAERQSVQPQHDQHASYLERQPLRQQGDHVQQQLPLRHQPQKPPQQQQQHLMQFPRQDPSSRWAQGAQPMEQAWGWQAQRAQVPQGPQRPQGAHSAYNQMPFNAESGDGNAIRAAPNMPNRDIDQSCIDLSKLLLGGGGGGRPQWNSRNERRGGPTRPMGHNLTAQARAEGIGSFHGRADDLPANMPHMPPRAAAAAPPQTRQVDSDGLTKTQRRNRRRGKYPREVPEASQVNMESMKTHLQGLQKENPANVFIARRINKLGLSSSEVLRSHFSQYGQVNGVYVSHSRVKLPPHRRKSEGQWRLRAAALGFVVMDSPDATSRILADGPEHCVNGVTVLAHPFYRWTGAQLDREEEEEEEEAADCKQDKSRENDGSDRSEEAMQEHPRSNSPSSDMSSGGNGSNSGHGSNSSYPSSGTTNDTARVAGGAELTRNKLTEHDVRKQREQAAEAAVHSAVEAEMAQLYNNIQRMGGPVSSR